jgi:translation elongation factor EF-Tu-like GTPase
VRFRAQLLLIPSENGGRQGPAVLTWRPAFRIDGVVSGTSTFLQSSDPAGPLVPGQTYVVWFELLSPDLFAGRLLPNARFGLYEGPRRVADGVIIEIA